MELLEIRTDFEADPAGRALAEFLAAQRAYERATARRVILVHLTVLVSFPVWLAALGYFSSAWRALTLGGFGLCLVGLLVAAAVEYRSHAATRSAERSLAVRRIAT